MAAAAVRAISSTIATPDALSLAPGPPESESPWAQNSMYFVRSLPGRWRRPSRPGRFRSSRRARTPCGLSRPPRPARASAPLHAATRRTPESSTCRAAARCRASQMPTPGRRTAPPRTRRWFRASDSWRRGTPLPVPPRPTARLRPFRTATPKLGHAVFRTSRGRARCRARDPNLPRDRLIPVARRVLSHHHLEAGQLERCRQPRGRLVVRRRAVHARAEADEARTVSTIRVSETVAASARSALKSGPGGTAWADGRAAPDHATHDATTVTTSAGRIQDRQIDDISDLREPERQTIRDSIHRSRQHPPRRPLRTPSPATRLTPRLPDERPPCRMDSHPGVRLERPVQPRARSGKMAPPCRKP